LYAFFSDYVFSLPTFFKKKLKVRFFKIDPTSVEQHKKAAKGAVANSGSDSSLLFLFSNGCSSAAIKFYKYRER